VQHFTQGLSNHAASTAELAKWFESTYVDFYSYDAVRGEVECGSATEVYTRTLDAPWQTIGTVDDFAENAVQKPSLFYSHYIYEYSVPGTMKGAPLVMSGWNVGLRMLSTYEGSALSPSKFSTELRPLKEAYVLSITDLPSAGDWYRLATDSSSRFDTMTSAARAGASGWSL